MDRIDFRPGDYRSLPPEPPKEDKKASLISRILSHVPVVVVNIASFFNKMLLGLSGLFFKATDITKSPEKSETTAKTQFVFARYISQVIDTVRRSFSRTSFDSQSIGSSEGSEILAKTSDIVRILSNLNIMNPSSPQSFGLEKSQYVGFRGNDPVGTKLEEAQAFLDAFKDIPDTVSSRDILAQLFSKSADFNTTAIKNFLNQTIVSLEPSDKEIVGAERFQKAQIHLGHNLFTNHFNFNLAAHITKDSIRETLFDVLAHKLGNMGQIKNALRTQIEAFSKYQEFQSTNPEFTSFDHLSIQACKSQKGLSEAQTECLYDSLKAKVLFQYHKDEERLVTALKIPGRDINPWNQRKEAVDCSILNMNKEDALSNLYDLAAYDYYDSILSHINSKNPEGGLNNKLEAMTYVFENTQASDSTLMQNMGFNTALMDNIKSLFDSDGFQTQVLDIPAWTGTDFKREIMATKQLPDGHELNIQVKDIKTRLRRDAEGKALDPDQYVLKVDQDGMLVTEASRYRFLMMMVDDRIIEIPFVFKTIAKHTESQCKLAVSSPGFIYKDIYLDGELMVNV